MKLLRISPLIVILVIWGCSTNIPGIHSVTTLNATKTSTPHSANPNCSKTPVPLSVRLSLTSLIADITDSPADYVGKEVEIVGFYYHWYWPLEMSYPSKGPPITRSDPIIADLSGAIYLGEKDHENTFIGGLKPELCSVIRTKAIVRVTENKQLYLDPYYYEVLRQ